MSEELEQIATGAPSDVFERLAVLQAIYKASAEQTKRNGGGTREQADKALIDMYQDYGTDRVKLKVLGETVGNLSIVFVKEHAEIANDAEFNNWAVSSGYGSIVSEIDPELMSAQDLDELYEQPPEWFHMRTVIDSSLLDAMACTPGGIVYFKMTGEPVPGLRWVCEKADGTIITQFKPDKVFDAMKTANISAVDLAGLLGGGE